MIKMGIDNMLGDNTIIKGKLISDECYFVNGKVDIKYMEINSLYILKNGYLTGEIKANIIFNYGELEGEIIANEIYNKGEIKGNIHTKKITFL